MRWFVDYLRQICCAHEWEEVDCSVMYSINLITSNEHTLGKKWTYKCKKCGLMKTYKNY